MFLNALAVTTIVFWLGGAGICTWMDHRKPWLEHLLPVWLPVAGVVAVLWLVFG